MAWLNAVPKPPAGTKRAARADDLPQVSRLDRLKADKVEVAMPPNPAPHIVTRLIEIGLTEQAGMGAAPLSWGEINEWQRSTSVSLPPWEARLIRRLSTEYLAEGRKAESENSPPPWRAPVSQRELDADEERLRALLG